MSYGPNTRLSHPQHELAVYGVPDGPDVALRALRRIVVPSSPNSWATVTMGGVFQMRGQKVGVLTASDPWQGIIPPPRLSDEATSDSPSNRALGCIFISESQLRLGLVLIHLSLKPPELPHNLMDIPGGFGNHFTPNTIVWEVRQPRHEVWIMSVHGVVTGRILSDQYSGDEGTKIELVKGNIEPEDRGSWVIDPSTKAFLGIIVKIAESEAIICMAQKIWREILLGDFPPVITRELNEDPGVVLVDAREFLPEWKPPDIPHWIKGDQKPSRSPPPSYLHRLKHLVRGNSYASSEYSPKYPIGDEVGMVGTQKLWSLTGEVEREWSRLEPQLRNIIWQTPPVSQYKPSSPVALHVYLMGKTSDDASPTVIIGCASRPYAKNLRNRLKNSQLLDTERYEVIIPHEKIKWGPHDDAHEKATKSPA